MYRTVLFASNYRHKWTGYALFFLGLILFTWLLCVALAPLHYSKQLENGSEADYAWTLKYDSAYLYPETDTLLRELIYRDALLNLSENDSIQLVLNLSDSTINLSIKGIFIHRSKYTSFTEDRIFKKLALLKAIQMFSKPLLLQSQYATIVKEPIVIRHAPKDTVEAALNAWEPDTLIQNPAFVSLIFDHNIHVILEQEGSETFLDKKGKFEFYYHLRMEKLKRSVNRFFSLQKQEYYPEIKIKMPVEELRAVYRALPNNTYMVLKL